MTETTQPGAAASTGGDRELPTHVPLSLDSDQTRRLRANVEAFNAAPAAVLRRRITGGFYAACAVLAVIFAIFAAWWPALIVVVCALITAACDLTAAGLAGRSALFTRVAQLLAEWRPADLALLAVGAAVVLTILGVLKLVGALLAILLLGALLAGAAHLMLDRKVAAEQRAALERIEQLLKTLRRRGADEQRLRQLLCEHGGDGWRHCFETIFGYDAAVEADNHWGRDELGRPRSKPRVLYDRLMRWLDGRIKARQAAASAEADEPPSVLKDQVDEPPPPIRAETPPVETNAEPTATTGDSPGATEEPRPAARPNERLERDIRRSIAGGGPNRIVKIVFGPHLRFVFGALLMAACAQWMHQNGILPLASVDRERSVTQADEAPGTTRSQADPANGRTQPLRLPRVPESWTSWINSHNVGLAGVVLVVSAFFGGGIVGVFAIAAAAVMIFGHQWGIRGIRGFQGVGWGIGTLATVPQHLVTMAAGVALAVVGVLLHVAWRGAERAGVFGAVNERRIALLNARGEIVHDATRRRHKQDALPLATLRTILAASLRTRASDMHLDPDAGGGFIRMRVDGSMFDVTHVDEALFGRLLRLVKILCDLDITKQQIVQEGHFSAAWPGREVDYRVSLAPAVHGQKLAIRVLDAATVPQTTDQLLLPKWMARQVRALTTQQSGMLLACGPTGCGKTTTLYAILRDIDVKERNVITIEDPVEYQLHGITQIQVNEKTGNTFSSLLRSTLRQDPDVLLLGEIRDADTARTAMQAAMTGHLVFSTLHARDAAGAIIRLLDLGVEPNLLASSLNLVLVQRLVRVLCPRCKVQSRPNPVQLEKMGHHGRGLQQVFRPRGCAVCLQSGFHGRRAMFELLAVDESIRQAIQAGPTVTALQDALRTGGFVSLSHMGWQAVAEGITSVNEVLAVTEAQT